MTARSALRRLIAPARRLRGRLSMSLGRIGSARPLSSNFGFERGTPIDRYYIERFLDANRSDIRGRVLEIGDDSYSRRFGGGAVTRQDILHVQPGSPRATIVGDLATPGVLPEAAFDCIVLTQTLHLIYDMAAAVEQVHRALRPGGVALVTVPGVSTVDRGEWKESWCWSLSEKALKRLLSGPFDAHKVGVESHGNLFAATAFLHGAAIEEVRPARLDARDPSYPVTVAARAVA